MPRVYSEPSDHIYVTSGTGGQEGIPTPTNFHGVGISNGIRFTWNAVNVGDGYRISFRNISAGDVAYQTSVVPGIATTQKDLTGISQGNLYEAYIETYVGND